MTTRPYHHGHLRDTLLTEAERTLREDGIEGLSLRDLARQAGVSHAAPRRHFADRQALLDALAETGFLRLGDQVTAAVAGAGPDYQAQMHAMATAYVRFATHDSALLDLMFARKNSGESSGESAALTEGSTRLFTAVGDLIHRGRQAGLLPAGDPDRLRLLLAATLQGIATLVTSGRVLPDEADALVTDTVTLFTSAG